MGTSYILFVKEAKGGSNLQNSIDNGWSEAIKKLERRLDKGSQLREREESYLNFDPKAFMLVMERFHNHSASNIKIKDLTPVAPPDQIGEKILHFKAKNTGYSPLPFEALQHYHLSNNPIRH